MAIEIKIDYETNRGHIRNPNTGEIIVVGAMAVWPAIKGNAAFKEAMENASIILWPSDKPELLLPREV